MRLELQAVDTVFIFDQRSHQSLFIPFGRIDPAVVYHQASPHTEVTGLAQPPRTACIVIHASSAYFEHEL
ncbi:hypothetical protein D3C78_1619450 [compost metagenome]